VPEGEDVNLQAGHKKVLVFGLLGALGCLAGWLCGEALLRAALPAGAAESAPSLVSKPALPAAPALGKAVVPALPAGPPPASKAPPLPGEFARRLELAGGKDGDPHLTLIWSNTNDLDLHCVDPFGERIYFGNKVGKRSRGVLDVDRNAGGRLTREPVENIRWRPPGAAPAGRYQVFVRYFSKHDAVLVTPYKVSVRVGNRRREFLRTMKAVGEEHRITEFTLPAKDLRLALPAVMEVFRSGTNALPVRLARENFSGPVRLTLEGDLADLAASEVTIPADRTEGKLVVKAAGASAGTRHLTVRARPNDSWLEETATFELKVTDPPAVLRLAAPSELEVPRSGTNTLPLRLARANFPGPVVLRLAGDLAGLTAPEVSVAEDSSEAEVPVTATGAAPGRRELTVWARGEAGKPEVSVPLALTVKASAPAWSWLLLGVIGLWTALLAVGLALALVMGQNRFLARPLLSGRQALLVAAGGLAAGLVAGGLGQALFALLAGAGIVPQVGFAVGWLLLGGLLGRGVGSFIPNLDGRRAALAGAAGGLLGAGTFILVTGVGGDTAGRFCGAALLGLCIGLMVALVEAMSRSAWLEVQYGPREVGLVNLGPEPVSIGGSARDCTVFAREAAPVALRYWFKNGKVLCEDVATGAVSEAPIGQPRPVGAVTVTVRTAAQAAPTATAPVAPAPVAPVGFTFPAPPRPPAPVTVNPPRPAAPPAPVPLRPPAPVTVNPPRPPAPAPVPPRPPVPVGGTPAPRPPAPAAPAPPRPQPGPAADACPGCGRKAPGTPGQRYCMICDRMY
jgi:hypothetical protein